ncbi:MAG: hypothetical protein IT495_08030 [Gammaproteobacteria bacterium]|nr:hypothetical protein [Gammaproteobacteria bacterium]
MDREAHAFVHQQGARRSASERILPITAPFATTIVAGSGRRFAVTGTRLICAITHPFGAHRGPTLHNDQVTVVPAHGPLENHIRIAIRHECRPAPGLKI